MTFGQHYSGVSGLTMKFRVRKLDGNNLQTDYWNDSTSAFVTSEPAASADRVTMTEESSSGFYEGNTAADLETYTGSVMIVKYSSGVALEHETIYVQSGVWANNRVTLSDFTDVPAEKTWQAKLGGTSDDIVIADSAYDDFYAMDFKTILLQIEESIDEAVTPTAVDQSTNAIATSDLTVSLDRRKVFFKTATLTANRVYEIKVVCTTAGAASNLISTGILRT